MNLHPNTKFSFFLYCFACFSCFVLTSVSSGQVQNGEFNDQTGDNVHWWYATGDATIERTAEQANNGTYAALISNRDIFWNGAGQSLIGDLTPDKDYHFQCRVRTKDVESGLVRIEIAQTDDRGVRFLTIAQAVANDSEWTLLEGGFHLQTNGNLDDISFAISGHYADPRLFDFYVDSVTITENDWRAAADARIEQIRKRDVVLNFVDDDGQPVDDIEVDIQQIGHRFAFGSTLNDAFIQNPIYAEFFKQNFEWATIEWYAQWKPVEKTRGIEDYTNADATVAFARENGIELRGHALTWPDTRFAPAWLPGLSAEEHRNEIFQRIDNVASRYAGQLPHWDVCNEMLNFTYFLDNAGPDIRAAMFQRARENDPNVKLFTNEFGLTESQDKAARYRALIQGLQAQGADIGGIGLQSHYGSFVSPKAMELTLNKLTDLGPEIWFTEFDVGNSDAQERAKQLEAFYRYAFSVPEAEGVIMWGFWAGTHWRGGDASIVDQDWTVNAAGQKYFELLGEWTTRLTTSVSAGVSQTGFRGFHGNYLITTTRNGIQQFHVVSVEKAEAGEGAVSIELNVSSDPDSNQSVVVYGTSADDEFKYDFANPTAVEINGVISHVPALGDSPRFTIFGGDGDDRLEIIGSEERERFLMGPSVLQLIGGTNRIVFRKIEDVECLAGNDEDQMIMLPTVGSNEFVSEPTTTQWNLIDRKISATDFRDLICRSRNDQDVAVVLDGESQLDVVATDFNTYVRARAANSVRQFQNFLTYKLESRGGDDVFVGQLSHQPAQITATMTESQFAVSGRTFEISGFDFSRVDAQGEAAGSVAVIEVDQDAVADTVIFRDENLSIRRGTIGFSLTGVTELETVSGSNDRVIIIDGSGNDTVDANSDRILTQVGNYDVTSTGTGATIVVASEGGTDIATEQGQPVRLRLVGDWISQ